MTQLCFPSRKNILAILAMWIAAGCGQGPTAAESPSGRPKLADLPAETVQAWKAAGADYDWWGMTDRGSLDKRPDPGGLIDPVPTFSFPRWKTGVVRDLPVPQTPFGFNPGWDSR